MADRTNAVGNKVRASGRCEWNLRRTGGGVPGNGFAKFFGLLLFSLFKLPLCITYSHRQGHHGLISPRNSLCSQRKTPFPQRESNGICFLLTIEESIRRERSVPKADPAPGVFLKPKAKIRDRILLRGPPRSTHFGSLDLPAGCLVGLVDQLALLKGRTAQPRPRPFVSARWPPSQYHASEPEQGESEQQNSVLDLHNNLAIRRREQIPHRSTTRRIFR